MIPEKILKNLLKRAEGYVQRESQVEYQIDEDGNKRAIKERVTEKEVPPDVQALKIYLELTNFKSEFENMSDEEISKEKKRLIKELKED
jgi:hypothetical protein